MANIPQYRRGLEQVVKKTTDEYGKANWELDYKVIDKQDQLDEAIDQPRHTKSLQARNEAIKFKVGEKRMVMKDGPKKDQLGFYCELCDELATDSLSWLDHLNSQQHNRLLGMNMKVDKVQVSDVQEKLKMIAAQKKQGNNNNNVNRMSIDEIRRQVEEKEKLKKQKKKNQKQEIKKEDIINAQDSELQEYLNKGK